MRVISSASFLQPGDPIHYPNHQLKIHHVPCLPGVGVSVSPDDSLVPKARRLSSILPAASCRKNPWRLWRPVGSDCDLARPPGGGHMQHPRPQPPSVRREAAADIRKWTPTHK
ncbi:unnamed protein product [Urochloa humidicola]